MPIINPYEPLVGAADALARGITSRKIFEFRQIQAEQEAAAEEAEREREETATKSAYDFAFKSIQQVRGEKPEEGQPAIDPVEQRLRLLQSAPDERSRQAISDIMKETGAFPEPEEPEPSTIDNLVSAFTKNPAAFRGNPELFNEMANLVESEAGRDIFAEMPTGVTDPETQALIDQRRASAAASRALVVKREAETVRIKRGKTGKPTDVIIDEMRYSKKEVLDNIKAKKGDLSDHIDEDFGGMSTEEMQSHLIKFDKLTAEIRKLEEAMREFRRVEEEGEIEISDEDLQKEIDDLF